MLLLLLGSTLEIIVFKFYRRFPTKMLKLPLPVQSIKKKKNWFFLTHCEFISKEISNKSYQSTMNLNFYKFISFTKMLLVLTLKDIF